MSGLDGDLMAQIRADGLHDWLVGLHEWAAAREGTVSDNLSFAEYVDIARASTPPSLWPFIPEWLDEALARDDPAVRVEAAS